MRAVKIDPISRTVTEIKLKKNPNSTLQELYSIIGGDLVELIQIDEDMVMECLEILSDNKGMKPEFRMKAKETLKRLGG